MNPFIRSHNRQVNRVSCKQYSAIFFLPSSVASNAANVVTSISVFRSFNTIAATVSSAIILHRFAVEARRNGG
jgi:hypothetical protein